MPLLDTISRDTLTSTQNFVQKFLRLVYVDNLSFGADCEDDMVELYLTSKLEMAEGGFKPEEVYHKFSSPTTENI